MSVLTQSYHCGSANSPIIYETIGNYLDHIVAQYPDNEALVVRHQNIRWSYAEYNQQINSLAAGLLRLGVQPGDRVGIWGPNSFEWALVQFATAKIGAVMVCINPAYRLYELEYALNKVECSTLISAESFKTSQYLAMLNELAPELANSKPGKLTSAKLPHLKSVIRMGEANTPGMYNFAAVCKMGEQAHYARLQELKHELNPDDAINIQFTSGTTGSPKGATLTHCNILNNGYLNGEGMRLTADDRLCIPVPLYHCFGMVMGNLACITHGSAAIYPAEAFDPLQTLQCVQEERCSALHGVPTMFVTQLEHPQFGEFDLSSLRTGIMAGAPCPVEVMKRVINEMHMSDVLIAYGQTETSPVNHITLADDPIDKRVETVGRAAPWLEIKVIDDKGSVVAIGEKGEVCCRGYSVMQGYWGEEEKTRDTIDRAGWLHSGDLGVMDEQGYLRIVGRIKDMIIRGGENVYPREVEEFLYTHPSISEVQVFGVADHRMGEEVCAWVKLKDGAQLSEQELKDFCQGRITHFKIPRHIRFVDEYPMTVTGKMQKYIMSEMMTEQLAIE